MSCRGLGVFDNGDVEEAVARAENQSRRLRSSGTQWFKAVASAIKDIAPAVHRSVASVDGRSINGCLLTEEVSYPRLPRGSINGLKVGVSILAEAFLPN